MRSAAAQNTHTYYIELVANLTPHVPPTPFLTSQIVAIVALPVAMSTQANSELELPRTYGAALGRWSGYMRELFSSRQPPPLGSVDPDKIEQLAREKLRDHSGVCTSPGAWCCRIVS